MNRPVAITILLAGAASLFAMQQSADDTVVFRSDVALVRVDAQVVDSSNRAITGLNEGDFVLRDMGKPQQIRNFANESMPLDVLLLFDVSSSMRPHVERIANAAHQAFGVLGEQDRIGIMVFDRSTRLRLPFRQNRDEVSRELDRMMRQESFHGGTDITRAMLDAARYVGREGRKDARRAIVILTDDQTEFDRNDEAVLRALANADAVLSALIAPDAMGTGSGGGGGYPGGGYPRGGGGYPGGGGGVGWPGGGYPRRGGGYPGGGYPGGGGRYPGGYGYPHTRSAGTSEIAERNGGDSIPVDDASALETTLERLRHRYALHYNAGDLKSVSSRSIQLDLSPEGRRRYPDAEIRYRRVYMADNGSRNAEPIMVTHAPASHGGYSVVGAYDPSQDSGAPVRRRQASADTTPDDNPPTYRRRRAVNEDGSSTDGTGRILTGGGSSNGGATGGWRKVDDGNSTTAMPASQTTTSQPAGSGGEKAADKAKDAAAKTDTDSKGGWRRVKPNEQQQ